MEHAILIFDGMCNFCNGFVNVIIDRDPKKKIKFVASQSESGEKIREKYHISKKEIKESIILFEEE